MQHQNNFFCMFCYVTALKSFAICLFIFFFSVIFHKIYISPAVLPVAIFMYVMYNFAKNITLWRSL